ncbi:SMP-30/gluconolactonase/LRE family protein [Microbacterium rhizomatis]|uniref:SMP-30/gluconolactonase/LRE family protein n=1 Tax=Microbacterium rhizomatis TaxID=1631477 RepID=UPI001478B3FD|nr:SMP-30/gluconolactonase/LRE family protein [Microbacterium rhizomatis]
MELIEASALGVASRTASLLGESPRWDARRGSLWWVDIVGSALHELRADGSTVSFELEHPAGAVNLVDDGTLLLATTEGLEVFDPDSQRSAVRVPVERELTGRRMNDAAVDAHGRVYAGTMRWDAGEPPHDGVLYRIDPKGNATPILSEVGCPNGIAWPQPGTMAFVDSLTRSIGLWAVDPASGALIEQTGAIDVSRFDGIPDGIALDAVGTLWVAFWGGGAVRRVGLDGTPLATIELPTALVTAVAFGGDDLGTLYITTAREAEDDDDTGAGRLYRCAPGQRGVLPHRWASSSAR